MGHAKYPVEMNTFGMPQPVRMFFGTNALGHALTFLWHGNSPTDAVFSEGAEDATIDAACFWSAGKFALPLYDDHPLTRSDDCHAKVYLVNGEGVVLSSQNNGRSPLLEFACVFEDRSMYEWFHKQIDRCKKNRNQRIFRKRR